jgi:2'-5' RNA ligase
VGFAVELNFDPVTTAKIRDLWIQLADADISSFMLDVHAEPHISLAVFDDIDLVSAGEMVADFASWCPPISIKLGAVGSFPTAEGVVYLAPIVTAQLLEVHGHFHTRLTECGLLQRAYYKPDNWIPHCTVAAELKPHEVGPAVDLCRAANLFDAGTLNSVAVIEFRPVIYHCRFKLGG